MLFWLHADGKKHFVDCGSAFLLSFCASTTSSTSSTSSVSKTSAVRELIVGRHSSYPSVLQQRHLHHQHPQFPK